MEQARQRVRFVWMGILVILAFLALGYRLVDLQVLQHEEFRELANEKHAVRMSQKGRRGDILDAHGEVLARSVAARTIAADPTQMLEHAPAVAAVLAPLLNTNLAALQSAFQVRYTTNDQGRVIADQWVPLRRKVPYDEWMRIRSVLTNATFGLDPNLRRERETIQRLRRSVFADAHEDEIRVYPNRSLAGPVLGFTDVAGNGVEGLEAFLNEQLRGVDGYIQSEHAKGGREYRRFREVQLQPQHGNRVYLTLVAGLQMVAEEELAAAVNQHQARGGAVVMVQPRTGRILAMANSPSYDPNRPPLRPEDARRRRNWGVSYTFEPGSTFKIVAATAALDMGLLSLSDRVDCGVNGRMSWSFGRVQVKHRDDHAMKERYAPFEEVIAESSNIGTFNIALKVGKESFAEYLERFGFNQRTGVRLPMEERGLLMPVSRWTMLDYSRVVVGYSVSVTPLQLAMAMSALANDGHLMRPQIIDRIEAEDGTVLAAPGPEVVRQVCRPETARMMVRALRRVVQDGTGSLVGMDRYTVAGKTGTAKIAPYREERYYASFVGFFPTEAPELCMVVVLEDPNSRLGYYGGRVAGPVFRRIGERAAGYLGIQPDIPDATGDSPEKSGTNLTAVRVHR